MDAEQRDARGPDPEGAEARAEREAAGSESGGATAASAAEAGEAGGATATDAGEGTVGVVSAPGPAGPRRKSRRFPRITRDTARPEGGGRAASGDAPAPARQWPMITVLGLAGLGLLLTATGLFRVGTILIGVALLTGAVMRRVLPSVGMLAVRSRFTDMVTYGVMGAAITLLALMAQPNATLQIPFLDDILHFTISS
ncbi:hypothetical protein DSC45_01535 [Streptomyces sp. YIM 130001]|nr:hypothetical protein DSC45_01535 [Streptomyces sp. YIM 130001]